MYAEVFMNKEGMEVFEKFKTFQNAIIANASRHRIIDDIIKNELDKNADITCIIIGSGFDTRAFRLGSGEWIEIDESEVIAYKNECLPSAGCKNPLQRIPCDFAGDSLNAILEKYATGRRVIIIIEGVFIYLPETEISRLINTLKAVFPLHLLVCDLQTYRFFKKFNMKFQKVIQDLGASLCITSDSPEKIFLENGYSIREKIPILAKAMFYAKLTIRQTLIKVMLKTVLRNISDGYAVYSFEYMHE